MGARTQMFAVIASTVILITILFAGPMFHFLPKVVMGAVIVVAAVGMVELEDVVFYWQLRAWQELLLVLITFLFTIVLGVELGILLMIITSVFILVKYTSVPRARSRCLARRAHPLSRSLHPRPDRCVRPVQGRCFVPRGRGRPGSSPRASLGGALTAGAQNVIVLRVEESLYFANVEQIKALLIRIEHTGSLANHPGDVMPAAPPLYGVVIHAGGIPEIDATALQALKETVAGYKTRGVTVCYVKVRERVKRRMIRAGVIDSADSEDVRRRSRRCAAQPRQLFGAIEDAVQYVRRKRTLSEFIAEKRVELAPRRTSREALPREPPAASVPPLPASGSPPQ